MEEDTPRKDQQTSLSREPKQQKKKKTNGALNSAKYNQTLNIKPNTRETTGQTTKKKCENNAMEKKPNPNYGIKRFQ